MSERTKAQGLLTTADIFSVMHHEIEMVKSAHGGDAHESERCVACNALRDAVGEWFSHHAAGPEELAELERGRY